MSNRKAEGARLEAALSEATVANLQDLPNRGGCSTHGQEAVFDVAVGARRMRRGISKRSEDWRWASCERAVLWKRDILGGRDGGGAFSLATAFVRWMFRHHATSSRLVCQTGGLGVIGLQVDGLSRSQGDAIPCAFRFPRRDVVAQHRSFALILVHDRVFWRLLLINLFCPCQDSVNPGSQATSTCRKAKSTSSSGSRVTRVRLTPSRKRTQR